eukprot:XP_028352391.1 phospholipase B1, membrane-associated-like [Physeter catodon]
MEPAGQKDEPFSAKERRPVKCPSQENPYLFTYRNSNYLPRLLKSHVKFEVRDGTEIRCPDKDPSDTIPTSVHRLKLADIKVIGALGDSLTAGNGAGSKPGNVLDVLTQYRGLSWSVGGDQNLSSVTTLPNILREFNPSLKGFSVGTGKENSPGAFLNQAVAGARAEDLPVQARRLVDLMKNYTNINFQEDWKIITLFIGGNDLCDVCDDPVRYSPQNFTDNIGKALDILHAEVPRAFVNLVKVLEIISLRELYQEKHVSCPRLILRNLCPCVLRSDDNSAELASLIEVNKKYQVHNRNSVAIPTAGCKSLGGDPSLPHPGLLLAHTEHVIRSLSSIGCLADWLNEDINRKKWGRYAVPLVQKQKLKPAESWDWETFPKELLFLKADTFTCHCPRTESHAVTEHLVFLKEFVS